MVLGHELAGTVADTGKNVTRFKAGDHVSVDSNSYCGKCRSCRTGKKQLCEALYAVGVNWNGGFAEYCAVPETQCYLLSPDIPLRYGAMAEPLACCLHGIDRAGIRPGGTVCVVGGGAIGLMMVRLAKMSGASYVLLSEPVAMRREIGLKLGADAAADPFREDIAEAIERHTGAPGADTVIECVGNTDAVCQAFRAAGRGASVLLFSVPKAGSIHELALEDMYRKELTVLGSMINPDTHSRAVDLINRGKINPEEIITHSFPLERLEEAVRMQMSDESIKVIVEP